MSAFIQYTQYESKFSSKKSRKSETCSGNWDFFLLQNQIDETFLSLKKIIFSHAKLKGTETYTPSSLQFPLSQIEELHNFLNISK